MIFMNFSNWIAAIASFTLQALDPLSGFGSGFCAANAALILLAIASIASGDFLMIEFPLMNCLC